MLWKATMERRIRTIEAQIAKVKQQLAELGELRPGTLSRQYTVCGSAGCRCKANPPRRHGPYYHLSYTRHGKGGTRLIRKEDLGPIRTAVANYARLKQLIDRWIDLSTELSDLKLRTPRSSNHGRKLP
jgi:hypothetical protein